MSEARCARCDGVFPFDPAKAIDHIGNLFVFMGYCQTSGHRNYLVFDAVTFDSVIIAMPSSVHSAFALENRELAKQKRGGAAASPPVVPSPSEVPAGATDE